MSVSPALSAPSRDLCPELSPDLSPDPSPARIVDRLGDVRQLIRDLRAEEESLRAVLLDRAALGEVNGARFQAVVTARPCRRFRRDLLPQTILNDTKYWQTRSVHTIRVRPIDGHSDARENATQKEDIQLIEPW